MITFENVNAIIVYALKRIIFFDRNNRYIFVVHCVWLISFTIGLQQGQAIYIDNLHKRAKINTTDTDQQATGSKIQSPIPNSISHSTSGMNIFDLLHRSQQGKIPAVKTKALTKQPKNQLNTISNEQLQKYLYNRIKGRA